MRLKMLLAICLSGLSSFLFAQSKLPVKLNQSFNRLNLSTNYKISAFLRPAYLQADFNKDGIKDIAILVVKKATKKRGILLIHGGSDEYYIFGAGTKFGNGGNNFDWLKGWSLYNEKVAYQTTFDKDGNIVGVKEIKLKRPAFLLHDLQDGAPTSGAIIYWTGKNYIWIHQGE